jgi:hypothetical protein
MSLASGIRKAIVIGGRDEALDLTVLLANSGVGVLLTVPEEWAQKTAQALMQNVEVWESELARSRVQIKPIQNMLKDWAHCDLLLDVRDEALLEDSLWKAIGGHVPLRALKAKVSHVESVLPEGWAALWWLGPLLQHRNLELQAGSSSAEAWKDLLIRRMGLDCYWTQGPALLNKVNIRFTRCFLDQLEAGAELEALNRIWGGVWRGAPWFAPESLSSYRIQSAVVGQTIPEVWGDTLCQHGVVLRKNNNLQIYAGRGEYRAAKNLDSSHLKDVFASSTLEMRIRQFMKMGGPESKWLWVWLKELLKWSFELDVSSRGECDNFFATQMGWSVGPMMLLDQLGREWLAQKLKIEGEISLSEKVMVQDLMFIKIQGRERCTRVGASIHRSPLKVYQHHDRQYLKAELENEHAGLWDGGDGLGVMVLRGPQNRLTPPTMELLHRSLEWSASQGGGLVITHEGPHFSAGEDWALLLGLAMEGRFKDLESWLIQCQQLMLQLRNSSVPVVIAAEGLCLGGASSLLTHAHHCVLGSRMGVAFEGSALGLPPTLGTLKDMALRASQKSDHEDVLLRQITYRLDHLCSGQPLWSIRQLDEHLLLNAPTVVRSSSQRVSFAARQLRFMLESGWAPASEQMNFTVLGANGWATLEQHLFLLRGTQRMDDHLYECAKGMAKVLCVNQLSTSCEVHEKVILDGERELFLSQMGKESVRKRLENVLRGQAHA